MPKAETWDHSTSGSDKHHSAHWFESQLIHYGLQPLKTKSVARMHLFDAANAGTSRCLRTQKGCDKLPPKTTATVEADTKKTATAGNKRKATDDSGVTTKKPKTTDTMPKTTTTPKPKAPAKTSTKATVKAAPKVSAAEAAQAQRNPSTARYTAKPRLKTTARCTGPGGVSLGPARETGSTGRQMARRGGAWAAMGRIPAPSSSTPIFGSSWPRLHLGYE
ncbi:hypothetical protein FGRMN_1780 [Fusarium graminum]|nr:hypothetical protein FGRMN_1780 [Fusarium graminum]